MRLTLSVMPLAIVGSVATAQHADPVAWGLALYADNCLECHGPTAVEGEVGDIRGLSLGTVTGAVRSGPGMMPTIALTKDEIAAVFAYLAQL